MHQLTRRTKVRSDRGPRDRGAVTLIVTIVMSLVLVGIVSLVVDLGLARDTRRQAQEAADAAALAAANALFLKTSDPTYDADYAGAVDAAKTIAGKNFGTSDGQWSACVDPRAYALRPGGTQCISFQVSPPPSAGTGWTTLVRVKLPFRNVQTPFGGVFGSESVRVDAIATADVVNRKKSTCSVCVVGSGAHTIDGALDLDTGTLAVNGTLQGRGSVRTPTAAVLQGDSPPGVRFTPSASQDQPETQDPLRYLQLPYYEGLPLRTDPCTEGPGVYGDVDLDDSPGSACVLRAGLYVFVGTVRSTTRSIVGSNATLVFACGDFRVPRTCSSGGSGGGGLVLTGTATLSLTEPDGGPHDGWGIVAERDNPVRLIFRGDGTNDIDGTIYAASGTLDYGGNGPGGPPMDSLVVVGDLALGTSSAGDFGGQRAPFQSTYSQPNNTELTTNDIFLVPNG
ncbi:MAG: pilus assembly protein TadG-related protein [Actinomycetales bacterium]